MNTRLLIILLAALLCPEFAPAQNRSGLSVSKHAIRSGIAWFDASNQVVNAHGSCIVEDEGRYYLFGEFKTDSANVFIGFGCYSSQDLMNWKFERIVLPQQTDGLLGPNRIGERVKVMKCPETGEFVMYMHTDNRTYTDPNIGYATSSTINGVYQFQGALLHEGSPIRRWDMGTFQDTDGKGYLLIHHGMIYELSSDYKSAKRLVTSGQKAGESPAMFKSGGLYYWLSSNLTSWERNDNFYLTASSLEGPWTHRGFFAPEGTLTWNSQCSFVFPIARQKDTLFLYTGDRWSFPKQAAAATYVWQPILVKDGSMSLPVFQESWQADLARAAWRPVSMKQKSIRSGEQIIRGTWQTVEGVRCSNEKGAQLSFPFKGRRVGITGISKNTGGYARVWILDSKGKEVVGTTVDFYSKYAYSSLKFLSPLLPKGTYTLCIEVLGEHGVWYNKARDVFGSTDDYVMIQDVFVAD